MFQVWTQGHYIKNRLIGNVVATRYFQLPQFWAALSNGVKSSVCEPPAATNNYRLQHETDVWGVLAKSSCQHLQSPVHIDCLPYQANSPPKSRVPSKIIPAAAHASTAAQLVGGQKRKYLDHRKVRKPVDIGLFFLKPRGSMNERVGEASGRRRVNHCNGLSGDRRGRCRRFFSILQAV